MIFFPWDQLTDAVANVAHVLYCSASNNLPLTEGAVMELILQLTQVLNSLIREFATTVSTVQQLHCLSLCVCVCFYHTLYSLQISASSFCVPCRASCRWRLNFSRSSASQNHHLWPRSTSVTQSSSNSGSKSSCCHSCQTYRQNCSPASVPRTSPAPLTKPCESTILISVCCNGPVVHCRLSHCAFVLLCTVWQRSVKTWASWMLIWYTVKTSTLTSYIRSC